MAENDKAKKSAARRPRLATNIHPSGSVLGEKLADKVVDPGSDEGGPEKGEPRREKAAKARMRATKMLQHYQTKLSTLKTELGTVATEQLESVFEHGKQMLADDWEPKHMMRDSLTMSLNAAESLCRVYGAAYRLLQPPPREQ